MALGPDPLLQRLVDPDGRVKLVQADLKIVETKVNCIRLGTSEECKQRQVAMKVP